jgi:hypothetical protein
MELPEEPELLVEAMLFEEICLGKELCLSDDLSPPLLPNWALPGRVLDCL